MTKLLIDQAADVYCHGIARIDDLGPNRRVIFTLPSVDESGWESVVVKLILPTELMVKLAYMAIGADKAKIAPELVSLKLTSRIEGGMSEIEPWHRRQALQLACQLPEDRDEANMVIRALRDLVDNWVHPTPSTKPAVVTVIRRPSS